MKRYAGFMLDIERATIRVLGEHAESRPHGIHGYELAELLRQEASTRLAGTADSPRPTALRDNGTVYKILYRLGRIGVVTSHWEEPEIALEEGRPRRRYYVLTENGQARAANLSRRYQRRRRQGLSELDPRTLG